MLRSTAEEKYWQALDRIQKGHTLVVNVNEHKFRISNLSVALEAGKVNPKGYIRPQRYPELCDAIKAANAKLLTASKPSMAGNRSLEIKKRQTANIKLKELRKDYEILLEQYLNVVKENYELKAHMRPKKISGKTNQFDQE